MASASRLSCRDSSRDTAAFPGATLEQVALWGAQSGFQAIEIACWPHEQAARRYAGVTDIDVGTLDSRQSAAILNMLRENGLTISSLGYYPNPLHPQAKHRETVINHLKKVIDAAALLEVPVVGTFVGKDKDKTVPQNLEDFARIWPPIVKFARERSVNIAIENCPMLFSYDEWPGGNNLASTPAIWRKMWEIIPDEKGSNICLSLSFGIPTPLSFINTLIVFMSFILKKPQSAHPPQQHQQHY